MRYLAPYIWIGVAVCVVVGLLVGVSYQQETSYSKYDVKGAGEQTSDEPENAGGNSATSKENDPAKEEDFAQQQPDHVQSEQEREYSRHINESRSETVLLAKADAAIHEASYENAAAILQELCNTHGASADARTLLKLAACRETLGQQAAAFQSYQKTAAKTRIQPLQTAAKLGQARIWSTSGKAESARNELLRSLLTHRDIRSRPVESRLLHQLGQTAAHAVLADIAGLSLLSDDILHIPDEEVAAEEILDELVLSPEVTNENQPSHKIVQRVLKLDDSAETILLEVTTPALPALELLTQLVTESELELRIDTETTELLKKRVVSVNLKGVPLSIILDAVLAPLKCDWQQTEAVLVVNRLEQTTPIQQHAQAERLLRFAMTAAPDHSLAPHSQAALASLKQRSGETDAALRGLHRTLELFPAFRHPDSIWMNIGKCQLDTESASALDAFHKAADLGDRSSTGAAAYVYIGRVHLRNNSPQKAISPLRFAVEQASGAELQLDAQILLASAYLMSGHFKETQEVLAACIGDVNTETRRNEIALLSGLLRIHTQRSQLQRERDNSKLLTAANHVDCQTAFGEHWWYLKCVAYHELGFHEEAERLSKQFQADHNGLPVELKTREMIQSTASVRFGEELAPPRERQSPTEQFSRWLPFNAQTIQAGSANDVLILCKNVLTNPKTSMSERQQTLRLMGTIYQQRGDHDMAVKCFTDNLPTIENEETE